MCLRASLSLKSWRRSDGIMFWAAKKAEEGTSFTASGALCTCRKVITQYFLTTVVFNVLMMVRSHSQCVKHAAWGRLLLL